MILLLILVGLLHICCITNGFSTVSKVYLDRFDRSWVFSDQRSAKPVVQLSSSVEDDSVLSSSYSSSSIAVNINQAARVLYRFSRPHTIKGTILASAMGVTRALLENPTEVRLQLVPKAMTGLVALLCGNAYIVGINQIYDVKIDEINKPFLPIAAKMMTKQQAWLLVITSLVCGVSIVKTQFSSVIFNLYMIGVILGTIYSVPPVQLKRFPLPAGGIIAFVRGFLLNFGVYYAVREALAMPFQWNPVVVFISSFMTIFASVIAVTKDLPDIEGDTLFGINTLAATYGTKAIASSATAALSLAYLAAIAMPKLLPNSFQALSMVLGHSMGLAYLLASYGQFQPDDMNSVKKFYKDIWNLFYFEYMLYPFI